MGAFAVQAFAFRDGSGLQYLLTDHLGSVVAITDDSGTLITQQRYMPFGEVRTDVGAIAQTDFGYTGQRALDEGMGGLMDYRARFYAPGLGRFIQPDSMIPSLANPQSLNPFSYTNNNPIVFNDPTGHWPIPLFVPVVIIGLVLVAGTVAIYSSPVMHDLGNQAADDLTALMSPMVNKPIPSNKRFGGTDFFPGTPNPNNNNKDDDDLEPEAKGVKAMINWAVKQKSPIAWAVTIIATIIILAESQLNSWDMSMEPKYKSPIDDINDGIMPTTSSTGTPTSAVKPTQTITASPTQTATRTATPTQTSTRTATPTMAPQLHTYWTHFRRGR